MKAGRFILLIVLTTGCLAQAGPVRFEQIPADAAGYAHIDVDAMLASAFFREAMAGENISPADVIAQMRAGFGAQFGAVTIYTAGEMANLKIALLIQAAHPGDRQRLQAKAAGLKNVIVITYQDQGIYFTSDSIQPQPAARIVEPEGPATRPSKIPFSLNIGFDAGVENPVRGGWNPFQSPSYLSFVAPDLIVIASDLRCMTDLLDVLQGRKPSLANQDPQRLKATVPSGTIMIGAGLSANFRTVDADPKNRSGSSTTQPAVTIPPQGGFGLDLFGPFKAKARLARFTIWEDGTSLHVEAAIGMVDQASAEQVKNLVFGIKSLLILTQPKSSELIAPLEVRTAGEDAIVHWSFQSARLLQLVRPFVAKGDHDRSVPIADPATRPTR